MKNNKTIYVFILFTILASSFSLFHFLPPGVKDWVVPEAAKKVKNPLKPNAENLKSGKALFDLHCKSCHGSKGKGDGNKSKSLNTSCGDFTEKGFQSQTDGSICYKIKEGKGDMPSFKKKITDDLEIWSMVNYMRTFGPAVAKEEPKKPELTDDKKKVVETEVKKVPEPVKKEEKPVVVKKDSLPTAKDSLLFVEKNRINLLLMKYEKAFNASDTSEIAVLFTSNGCLIPLMSATVIGTEQIRLSYKKLFLLNTFSVKFLIDELQQSGDLAVMRVTSKGNRTNIVTNQKVMDESRGLFVLKKINDEWKIYSVMFN